MFLHHLQIFNMVTIITSHWIIAQLRDQKIFRFYIQVVRTVHHVGVLERPI